jgi:hypothetical protein
MSIAWKGLVSALISSGPYDHIGNLPARGAV